MSGVPILTNLTRQGVGNYPLLNDTDVKGGIWSVANKAARLAIQSGLRKAGMLVRELDTDDIWELNADLMTWGMFGVGAFPGLGRIYSYARSSGNDATGDGSLATPYASLTRCLKDIPRSMPIPKGRYYIIDITGITESVEGGVSLVGFTAEEIGEPIYDPAFPYEYQWSAPIYIYAAPALATGDPAKDEIAAGEIVSQNHDADTDLLDIVTNKSWVGINYADMLLTDDSGNGLYPIIRNDPTTLWVATRSTLHPPLRIVKPSATIQNTTVDTGAPALDLAADVPVSVVGVDLKRPDGWYGYSLRLAGPGGNLIAGVRCYNGGIYVEEGRRGGYYEGHEIYGLVLDHNRVGRIWESRFAGQVYAYSLLVHHGAVLFRGDYGSGFVGPVNIMGVAFDIVEIGRVNDYDPSLDGFLYLAQFLMYTPSLVGGPACSLNLRGVGVLEKGFWIGTFDTPNGFPTIDGGRFTINDFKGATVKAYGLQVKNGGVVKVNAGTTISGTNDMKVGNRAARSWADFRANAPLKNELDVDATTGTLARLWQA
jgi:hypothetical protein